jgi:opacity protein-like surface antigen
MKRAIFVALVALAVSATQAHGQMKVELDLGGGISEPTGDFGDAAKLGWHGLATLGVVPSGDRFAIQATGFYGEDDFEGLSGKWKLGGGLGEFRFDAFNADNFTGSVMLGGGFMHVKAEPSSGKSVSETKGAFDGGLGIAYMVGDSWGLTFQLRYVNVFMDGSDISFVPVTLGVRFKVR